MSIGSVLSCSPHIVENIFKHLSARDLCNCASVCTLWAVLSQEEIQRRREIVPFFQGIKCGKHRQVHRTFEPCSMRQTSKFENELKIKLQSSSVKPAFCIAFATTGLLEHFEKLFPTYFDGKRPRKRFKRCYLDYFDTAVEIVLQKNLPPTCCISLYIENHIIFYGGDLQSSLVETSAPAICGYLFPKLPDGEMKFYKRTTSCIDYKGQYLKNIIRNGPNIKSSLNLVQCHSLTYFQIALNQLRRRHDAFATGVIMPVKAASNYVPVFEGPKVQTFRFPMGRNVLAWEGNNPDEIMNEWRNVMEEKKALNSNSIAFMFSVDHDDCLVVCEIFKMVFPCVPLVGLFKCSQFDLDNILSNDFVERELHRSVLDSGLKHNCVFIFVTFDT